MKNKKAAELRAAYENGVRQLAATKNETITKAGNNFKNEVKALRLKIYG